MNGRPWSLADDQLLREQYADRPTWELAILVERGESAVYRRAYQLDLSKSARSLAKTRFKPGHSASVASQFRPGHRPHNQGVKGWQAGGRSSQTRFVTNNRPHNWQPIGSLRTRTDGYLEVKLRDIRPSRQCWETLHTLLWRQHHGDIPAGHCIIFVNNDRSDVVIENLSKITRRELAYLNKHGFANTPAPLRAAAIALARLDCKRHAVLADG